MQPIPLSCDWLALSLRLDAMPVGCPEGHTWAKYSPTNVWGQRWCLFNEFGEKVITLLFSPRSTSVIHAQAALLEVANEWLYHGIGLTAILDMLGRVVPYSITGISRLDLAADFTPTEEQAEVIRGLDNRSLYVAGKQNGSGFWSNKPATGLNEMWAGFCPHDMNWGHKTSAVKWKLYYKSKELRDAVGGTGWSKPYIVDLWREVGLDESNVWRLEVSIKQCNNFMWKGEPLSYTAWRKTGSDLFQSLYSERFQVRRSEGHRDRSNDTAVPFLPVGDAKGMFRCKVREPLAKHSGRITLLRHLVADVQTEEVMLSEDSREWCLNHIAAVVSGDGLGSYFLNMMGVDIDSWIEWVRVRAYYFEPSTEVTVYQRTVAKALNEAGIVPLATEP